MRNSENESSENANKCVVRFIAVPLCRVFFSPMAFATMANTPIPAHDTPMMLGVNSHVQAHAPQTFPTAPSSQQYWSTATPEYHTYVPVSVAPAASYDQPEQQQQHHFKRDRDGQQQQHVTPMMQEQESYVPLSDGMGSPSHGKKQRPSNYRPPQHVDKKSVVAVTGSLVGGGWKQNGTTVRMRRELSGGQLDQFFRNAHDAMEDDDMLHRTELRPRSMSF